MSIRDFPISVWELASIVVCASVFTAWNVLANATFSAETAGVLLLLSTLCWVAGRILTELFPVIFPKTPDFVVSFLFGFFFLNSMILLLQFLLPFGIVVDGLIVIVILAVSIAAKMAVQKNRKLLLVFDKPDVAAMAGLGLALVAASIWSRSSIMAVQVSADYSIFKPWSDSFYHAYMINAFAGAHGFQSMQGVWYSGQPISFYHFGSYLFSAELSALTRTTPYQAFGSFLVPFGLVLSAMAANVFARKYWGPWAGFAASAVLLLVPDPSQTGVSNHWYSYHWLQQIGPAGLYGVALMLLCWLAMIEACRSGRAALLALSYFLALVCINYKFHVFFASSFLLILYPAFFFGQLSTLKRAAWLLAALLASAGAVYVSQMVRALPYVGFDGSAYHSYMALVKTMFDNPVVRGLFSHEFSTIAPLARTLLNLVSNAAMIFLSAFGLIGIMYFVVALFLRKRMEKDLLLLPVLVMASFMLMSLLLSYDLHGLATPEELIHRPFVWAYYLVCVWVGGAVAWWLQGRQQKPTRLAAVLWTFVLILLGVVSFRLSANIQHGPQWGDQYTNLKFPNDLLACTSYVEANSRPDQIVQDSEYDKYGVVTALSRRHAYVTTSASAPKSNPEIASRLDALARLSTYTTAGAVEGFFANSGIAFYISHPEQNGFFWPKELKGHIVFSRNGYEVYYFGK